MFVNFFGDKLFFFELVYYLLKLGWSVFLLDVCLIVVGFFGIWGLEIYF